ncbi:phenylalanine 4-monooxygenase [Saccharospirillum salsuginis]|uniref:phenylalanine 4-monooxygenase n=1 Tax=Saccharospirillum salsuginis TaxID=418750 RepID=A0A918KJ64_9GAMM|nr:phenylalanine 4-monooxygenase [Saccharospirillum salsuginis]GGX64611.1 phenylalanine 4-monooxygenase [Saccharospirillum salsuginis]
MGKNSQYVAHQPDANGRVEWSDDENRIWNTLIERQLPALQGKACNDYMVGLDRLDLPRDRVPQLEEVDAVLMEYTGWKTAAVPALIDFSEFFRLLANKQFPVATFIRSWEELDYLQEPDIFHEIFGHTPMLTHRAFAEFTQLYGQLGLDASKEDRVFLARLYWFTVEFGLLQKGDQRSIYGGGILSSPGETEYAFNSDVPERQPFDLMTVLRTPYRIDIMQPIYYCLESVDQLYDIAQMDIMGAVREAKKLGLFEPRFTPKKKAVNQ